MTRRLHFFLLVGFLFTAGLGITLYQILVWGMPVSPDQTEKLWTVEARVQFEATPGRPIIARFLTPDLAGGRIDLS